jgi:5'-methylthioadenosine phosphorylase
MQTDQEKSAVEKSVLQFPALLAASLTLLKDRSRACHCKEALQRYRNKGMIGDDWKTWIGSV